MLFAVAVVAVARWRGFASLIGLAFAGFILVKFMFPALVAGSNPVMVGLIGSSAIMFVVLYAAHGFSARTSTALVGTLFGLILIAVLGLAASRWAHLTGVASEEDFVLSAAAPDLRLTSVVLCGIIVAGLGVLNDVTITQASAVWELADEGQGQRHLFAKAMRIGRDHIASTVYTIAFATAGATLSVLLLISIYNRPLLQVVQTEQFAEEIIRTLVGSIGLVLAVPLTTAVGVAVVRASRSAVAPPGRRPRPRAAVVPEPEPTPLDDAGMETTDGPAAVTTETAEDDTGERPVVSHAPDETGVLPSTRWRTFGQEPEPPSAPAAPPPARTGPRECSAARETPGAAVPPARRRGRLRRLHLPPRAGRRHRPGPAYRPGPRTDPGPSRAPRTLSRSPGPLTPPEFRRAAGQPVKSRIVRSQASGWSRCRQWPPSSSTKASAICRAAARSGPRSTVASASPMPTPMLLPSSKAAMTSVGNGHPAGLEAGPVGPFRSPAAISSAPLLARSCTAWWQSRSDHRGWVARNSLIGGRRVTPSGRDAASTASASAVPVHAARTRPLVQHQGADLGPVVQQAEGHRGTERVPDHQVDRAVGELTDQPAAATSGVSGRPARGLAPCAGRSGALTRQPASAKAGPTFHQVADDEVEPCSSSARRPAAPQERHRRNPGDGIMAAVCR